MGIYWQILIFITVVGSVFAKLVLDYAVRIGIVPEETKVEIPAGLLAVTTYGSITPETFQSLLDVQHYAWNKGIRNVAVTTIMGALVDKARNEAARQMLANSNWRYLMFVDADMSFPPSLLESLLATAYAVAPWADAVGALCPLRGKPYLPTTDYGSGTWEPTDPGDGIREVIRTGSACILVKRHVFERLEYPWYGVRPAPRPLDVLLELDNFARCKMDGRNPLREHPAWDTLERSARQDAAQQRPQVQGVPGGFISSVGEDSNFCDRMRAAGFRIVVNTDLYVGHVERRVITPDDHTNAMKESERYGRLAVGMTA